MGAVDYPVLLFIYVFHLSTLRLTWLTAWEKLTPEGFGNKGALSDLLFIFPFPALHGNFAVAIVGFTTYPSCPHFASEILTLLG